MNSFQLSRRNFVSGSIIAVGAIVIYNPGHLLTIPVIYGDGRHDDTGGLQALFDGRRVHVANAEIVACNKGGAVRLLNGDFLVRRPLRVRATTDLYTAHCNFIQVGWGAAPYPPIKQIG